MSDENTNPKDPKDLREGYERATARAAELEAEATAARAELREFKATTLFGNEKHAELFLKANPEADITPEAVSSFVQDYGLAVEPPAEAPPAEEPKPDPGAALGSISAASQTTGSAPAAKPKMTAAEFEALLVENPQEAAKAYVEGAVERNADNVQARDLVKKGIIDH